MKPNLSIGHPDRLNHGSPWMQEDRPYVRGDWLLLACYSLTESAVPREKNISNLITSQVSASCQKFNVDRCQENTVIIYMCVCEKQNKQKKHA